MTQEQPFFIIAIWPEPVGLDLIAVGYSEIEGKPILFKVLQYLIR